MINTTETPFMQAVKNTRNREAVPLPEELPESLSTKPLALDEFLKQDIKPVQYHVKGILPKSGRLMVTAKTNSGKSIFMQNMALCVASGAEKFLNQDVEQGVVLYIDCEMGESSLKDRFLTMTKGKPETQNLFLKHLSDLDLLNEGHQKQLIAWIEELKIQVVIIDPVGSAWLGDENDKQAVSNVTRFLNTLIDRFSISVVIVHHWKKSTKDIRGGGEMAAGSYKWAAWVDCHFTLSGDISSLTVSCEKARHGSRTKPFLVRLNEDNCWFEFVTNFEQKYTGDTLVSLFDLAQKDEMTRKELVDFSKANNGPSARKLDELVAESRVFTKRKEGRGIVICRVSVPDQVEFLAEVEESCDL